MNAAFWLADIDSEMMEYLPDKLSSDGQVKIKGWKVF